MKIMDLVETFDSSIEILLEGKKSFYLDRGN